MFIFAINFFINTICTASYSRFFNVFSTDYGNMNIKHEEDGSNPRHTAKVNKNDNGKSTCISSGIILDSSKRSIRLFFIFFYLLFLNYISVFIALYH
jgi:hypothetical protein